MADLGYEDFKLGHVYELLSRLAGYNSWNHASAEEADLAAEIVIETHEVISGMPDHVWRKAYEITRSALIPLAAKGRPCSYKFLAERILAPALRDDYEKYKIEPFGYYDQRLNELLGEVLRIERKNGRPPLTALITLQDDPNRCGASFYAYSEELGYFTRNPKIAKRVDELYFWIKSINELKAYWSTHSA